jgi:hypothetical protein
MTPPWGRNPFCDVPESPLAGGAYFPVGYSLADLFDLWANARTFRYSLNGASFGGGFGDSTGASGVTKRRALQGTAAPRGVTLPGREATDVVHLRASGGLANFLLDFSRVVTNPRRSLFFPRFTLQFRTEGSLVSTLPLPGGVVDATIDFGRGLTLPGFQFYTDRADIFLTLFGSVTVQSRYDQVQVLSNRAAGQVRLEGPGVGVLDPITFGDVTELWVGSLRLPAPSVSGDGRVLTVDLPAGAPREPLTVKTAEGDCWTTKEDV